MSIITFLIILIYCLLIFGFIIGFESVEEFKLKGTNPTHKFSIVIPFRNEAENLTALLSSIKNINYPAHFFEILFKSISPVKDKITDSWFALFCISLTNINSSLT